MAGERRAVRGAARRLTPALDESVDAVRNAIRHRAMTALDTDGALEPHAHRHDPPRVLAPSELHEQGVVLGCRGPSGRCRLDARRRGLVVVRQARDACAQQVPAGMVGCAGRTARLGQGRARPGELTLFDVEPREPRAALAVVSIGAHHTLGPEEVLVGQVRLGEQETAARLPEVGSFRVLDGAAHLPFDDRALDVLEPTGRVVTAARSARGRRVARRHEEQGELGDHQRPSRGPPGARGSPPSLPGPDTPRLQQRNPRAEGAQTPGT